MRGRWSDTFPLYVGGFLGPFGGAVLAVLVPQLRDAFDASTAEVAAAVPAYLVPFAALQLVSGTIGERLGRRRVVRTGYVAYAAASVACAVAPSIGAFLACRALQGAANAFLTPLLLAGLAEAVPAARIGRAVGTFAAVQTAAVALSPLCGGLIGALDWHAAFLAPAAVALALATVPPPEGAPRAAGPARLSALLAPRVGLLCGAAFCAYAGGAGVAFIVAVAAADAFGLGSAARGVVLAGFGLSGMLLGRASGAAVDRFDRVPVATAGALLCGGSIACLGLAGTPGALAALWFAAGAGSALLWAGLNTLAVEAVPGNRAGATSAVGAFKFAGNAAAPVMWLPLYHLDARLGFGVAGATTVFAAAFVLPLAGTVKARGAPGLPR